MELYEFLFLFRKVTKTSVETFRELAEGKTEIFYVRCNVLVFWNCFWGLIGKELSDWFVNSFLMGFKKKYFYYKRVSKWNFCQDLRNLLDRKQALCNWMIFNRNLRSSYSEGLHNIHVVLQKISTNILIKILNFCTKTRTIQEKKIIKLSTYCGNCNWQNFKVLQIHSLTKHVVYLTFWKIIQQSQKLLPHFLCIPTTPSKLPSIISLKIRSVIPLGISKGILWK